MTERSHLGAMNEFRHARERLARETDAEHQARIRRYAIDCDAGPVNGNTGLIRPNDVLLADGFREMVLDARMSLHEIVVQESHVG